MPDKIGHYTIVSQLGRGGMGVVYKAHEESLNRYVAIKVLGEHLAGDEAFLTRFVREAQAAAGLSHPNIVQIFYIGEDAGKHYFVMEYVSGRSLHSMIREEGHVDNPKAAQLMLQAAQGLAAAHDQGIIHRDIKPANLMLDPRGVVKIADFGLALPVEAQTRLTATGMLMGTPGYLAPEQVRNEQVDHRTDIYALGVSFYELLSGGVPFKAESPLALIKQIVDEEPPDIATLNPSVDQEARRILGKMIAKDRGERYQDCHQLVADLEEYIHSKGVRSATQGLATPTVAGVTRPGAATSGTRAASEAPTAVTPAPGSHAAPTAITPSAGTSDAPTMVTPAAGTSEAATVVTTPPASMPVAPTPPVPSPPVAHAAAAKPKSSSKGLVIAAIIAFLMVGGAGAAFVAWKFVNREGSLRGKLARSAVDFTEGSGKAAPDSGGEVVTGSMPDSGSSRADESSAIPEDGMMAESGGGTSLPEISPNTPRPPASSPSSGSADGGATSTRPAETGATQQKSPAAVTPSRLSGTMLAVSGDPTLTPYVSDIVMTELTSSGIDTEDASALPGWDDLMRQDPQTGYLIEQVKKAGYATLILVRADQTGSRELNYMGRYDTAYTTRVTIQKYDVASGRPVGQRASVSVEYTQLNAEREAGNKVGPVARQFVGGL
jgi:eukaryotic-like serine/threonine-protein kinase